MENKINKTFEYNIKIVDVDYTIQAVVSSVDDAAMTPLSQSPYKGLYTVDISVSPDLPTGVFMVEPGLILLLGDGESTKIGYIRNDNFIELDQTVFVDELRMKLITVLDNAGSTGHYKFDF